MLIGLLLWLTAYGIYLYNHRSRMRRRVAQVAHLINRVMRREVVHEAHIDGWLDNLFAGMRRMTSHHGALRTTTAPRLRVLGPATCSACTSPSSPSATRSASASSPSSYVVAYAVGTLAPTPGGLGAIEGIMIALFVSFGVPSATAVAVVLVYRLINFWLPIPPGFVAYLVVRPGRTPMPRARWRRRPRRSPGTAEPRPRCGDEPPACERQRPHGVPLAPAHGGVGSS